MQIQGETRPQRLQEGQKVTVEKMIKVNLWRWQVDGDQKNDWRVPSCVCGGHADRSLWGVTQLKFKFESVKAERRKMKV